MQSRALFPPVTIALDQARARPSPPRLRRRHDDCVPEPSLDRDPRIVAHYARRAGSLRPPLHRQLPPFCIRASSRPFRVCPRTAGGPADLRCAVGLRVPRHQEAPAGASRRPGIAWDRAGAAAEERGRAGALSRGPWLWRRRCARRVGRSRASARCRTARTVPAASRTAQAEASGHWDGEGGS